MHRLSQQSVPVRLYDAYGRSSAYGLQVRLAALTESELPVLPLEHVPRTRVLVTSAPASLRATLSRRIEVNGYPLPRPSGYLPEMGN